MFVAGTAAHPQRHPGAVISNVSAFPCQIMYSMFRQLEGHLFIVIGEGLPRLATRCLCNLRNWKGISCAGVSSLTDDHGETTWNTRGFWVFFFFSRNDNCRCVEILFQNILQLQGNAKQWQIQNEAQHNRKETHNDYRDTKWHETATKRRKVTTAGGLDKYCAEGKCVGDKCVLTAEYVKWVFKVLKTLEFFLFSQM